jgi:hypothetical protein
MLPKEVIEKFRKEYKKIGYVECPAFSGEKIYFNKYGFNHLLRKGAVQRNEGEQTRRLCLLAQTKDIVFTSKNITEYTKSDKKHPSAEFWSFVKEYDNRIIKVIIRKVGNGNKHFFSVMDKTK